MPLQTTVTFPTGVLLVLGIVGCGSRTPPTERGMTSMERGGGQGVQEAGKPEFQFEYVVNSNDLLSKPEKIAKDASFQKLNLENLIGCWVATGTWASPPQRQVVCIVFRREGSTLKCSASVGGSLEGSQGVQLDVEPDFESGRIRLWPWGALEFPLVKQKVPSAEAFLLGEDRLAVKGDLRLVRSLIHADTAFVRTAKHTDSVSAIEEVLSRFQRRQSEVAPGEARPRAASDSGA